jgi:hypothetical protein
MSGKTHRKPPLPDGFIDRNYGLTAHGKLLRQMEILDGRIRKDLDEVCSMFSFDGKPRSRPVDGHIRALAVAELELDTETFYTVAADFLKLAALIMKDLRFKKERIYRRIQATRNWLIRHAFEHGNGVASGVWAFGSECGPKLKAGSGSPLVL